jgi:hypothetical protein
MGLIVVAVYQCRPPSSSKLIETQLPTLLYAATRLISIVPRAGY